MNVSLVVFEIGGRAQFAFATGYGARDCDESTQVSQYEKIHNSLF
jgi:hypothetical protein